MAKQRKHSRVREIDDFIREYYPEYGPAWCAEKLGEERLYIRNRANYLKVRTRKRTVTPKKKVVKPKKFNAENLKLRKLNADLRLENIKLIDQIRRWKGQKYAS